MEARILDDRRRAFIVDLHTLYGVTITPEEYDGMCENTDLRFCRYVGKVSNSLTRWGIVIHDQVVAVDLAIKKKGRVALRQVLPSSALNEEPEEEQT